jgi:molybdopterin molybdotransferase
LIALNEAQARLISLGRAMPVETMPLIDAAGRWAAEDIIAKRTQPARDLSAMDGYAIAHADLPGPWRVIGESAAGRRFDGVVGKHEAVRIFTGAALPTGSDCIIIQEDVTRDGDMIAIEAALTVPPAQHVRRAGSDFVAGQLLIAAGDALTPARIALGASGGCGTLSVRARPVVAILSTGDELVPPGSDAGEDRLPSSNAVMIAAMLRDMPCDVIDMGIVPDTLDALVAAFQSAKADIIVTSGGASVGDHDLVRPALITAGASIDFWKIAMRPGKPLMAGKLGDSVVLGLPGNPVSAYVTALLFLKPLIAAMGGARDPLPERSTAILEGNLPETGPRTDHVRAILSGGTITPTGPNDSAAMLGLASANALIVRLPHSPATTTGDKIEYINAA